MNLLGCHLLSPFLPSLRLWEPDTAPGIQQCYGTCAWIYPHKHTVAGSWAVTTHFQMGHKQRQKSVISCTTWNSDSQKNSHFWNYGLTHFCELLRMKKPGAHVAAEARQPGSKLSNFERFYKKLRIHKKCFHIWICWGTEVMCCGRHSCFCTGTLLTSFFC